MFPRGFLKKAGTQMDSIRRSSFSLMLVLLSSIAIVVCVFLLTGCTKQKSNQIAISEDDISDIKKEIAEFLMPNDTGTQTQSPNYPSVEYTDESDLNTQEFVDALTKSSTITSAVPNEDSTATVTVLAPDMYSIMLELLSDTSQEYSQEEVMAKLYERIESQDNLKEFIVTVKTVTEGDKILLDATDETLIDAMTGGFRNAFQQIYIDYISSIMEFFSEEE